jgi:hypothetical protein
MIKNNGTKNKTSNLGQLSILADLEIDYAAKSVYKTLIFGYQPYHQHHPIAGVGWDSAHRQE